MRVALGTIDIDDETRKRIRQLSGVNGGKGDATRGEVKEYLLDRLQNHVIPQAGSESEAPGTSEDGQAADADDDSDQGRDQAQNPPQGNAPEPVTDEELPPVPGPGTSTGYTGGTTATTGTAGVSGGGVGTGTGPGNLGSDGTPGGTA